MSTELILQQLKNAVFLKSWNCSVFFFNFLIALEYLNIWNHNLSLSVVFLIPLYCSVIPLYCSLIPLYCSLIPLYCSLIPLYWSLIPLYYSVISLYCSVIPLYFSVIPLHCSVIPLYCSVSVLFKVKMENRFSNSALLSGTLDI